MTTLRLELGSDSNVGRVREHNEDTWETVAYSGGELLLVCDGMGGHEAGDVASQIASRTIAGSIVQGGLADPRELLYRALEQAHDDVLAAASAATDRAGMGTTAVVALVRAGSLFLGHVGDSRAYLVRDGSVAQLTRDQTKVQELVDSGLVAERDAKHHPDAGVLAQAIGQPRGLAPFVTPEETGIPLRAGDVLLLCSDGVYDALEAHELVAFTAQRSARDAARTVVSVAVERDGQDNATAVVARVHAAAEARAVPPTVVSEDGTSARPPAWRSRPFTSPTPQPGPGRTTVPIAVWLATLAVTAGLAFIAGRVTAERRAATPASPSATLEADRTTTLPLTPPAASVAPVP